MTLEDLGYNDALETYRQENQLDHFDVGRVSSEHKERYTVKTTDQDYEAEIIGNLRYSAQTRADFPAVGDWVAISEYDTDKVLIHAVFPRTTIIQRKAVGKIGDVQVIATNIDYALIVQAVDRDFNLNRLERYLTICHAAKVEPLIVLNKIDLIPAEEVQATVNIVKERLPGVPCLAISNESQAGYDQLQSWFQAGKTYCLLGSSGVGKSTLLNQLTGQASMETSSVSTSNKKGRHTTSHRELFVLPNGGVLIDNPGMREVGISDTVGGLEATFDKIEELAEACKFKDCTHLQEVGCAVLEALEQGELDEDAYENYQKMQRERAHFDATIAEKRRRDKQFGKMAKEIMKEKKRRKY